MTGVAKASRIQSFIRHSCLIAWLSLLLSGCSGVANGQTANGEDLVTLAKKQSGLDMPAVRSTQGLGYFYRDLAQLQQGKINQLGILELGDSHTANDFFSGRLRLRFQQSFGNAGRGMMPPGVIYKGLSHPDENPAQDAHWVTENSLKDISRGPYGISGFVARSLSSGARLDLVSTAPANDFNSVSVDYLTRPTGGQFKILLDGKIVKTVSTAGASGYRGHAVVTVVSPATRLSVVALHRDIGITAWSTTNRQHGITLSSHGVVSATARLFERWSPAIVRADIADLRPSLIIVAYGTNEGAEADFDAASYSETFTKLLGTLRQYAPHASILVVGPPDGEKMDQACQQSKPVFRSCSWATTPALDSVRAVQRKVAQATGAAFWDWSSVMPHGISSWVEGGWARQDHVHLTIPGYEASADQLFDRLMLGFNASPAPPFRQLPP